jgi:hypothetical protein
MPAQRFGDRQLFISKLLLILARHSLAVRAVQGRVVFASDDAYRLSLHKIKSPAKYRPSFKIPSPNLKCHGDAVKIISPNVLS